MSKFGTARIIHGSFTPLLTCLAVAAILGLPFGHPSLLAQEPAAEKPVPTNLPASKSPASESGPADDTAKDAQKETDVAELKWTPLPTGDQTIWKASSFGGDGDVTFTPESISMTAGDPITGVRCLAKLPKENFEIELEGRRNNNFDFFCALTFPVGENGQCSFVVGGWAGAVVGLSSVDDLDAARNSTKKLMHFENGQWYKIRTRVDEESIRCWIDDELVVHQPREGHKFDIRVEMHESLPLGIAAFMCDSEIRNVRWRQLKEEQ